MSNNYMFYNSFIKVIAIIFKNSFSIFLTNYKLELGKMISLYYFENTTFGMAE